MQLAYASTEYGAQGATADRAITLATSATTGRGLYVGMTRGRDHNQALVADTDDLAHAISVLEAAIAVDRADIPATTQRRTLAETVPTTRPRPRVQVPDWFHDLRADAQAGVATMPDGGSRNATPNAPLHESELRRLGVICPPRKQRTHRSLSRSRMLGAS